MRYAILSDIHANLEALEVVVEDLGHRFVDKVICLGDMIGYGPDPDGVISLIRKQEYECILGNHEAALFDDISRDWLNFQAKENNEATEKLLSAENLAYCSTLPMWLEYENTYYVHGYPPDSVLTYLHNCSDEKLIKFLTTGISSIYFVGHTHRLSWITMGNRKVAKNRFSCGITRFDPNNTCIINAGSVGQPRDGSNMAKYLVFDSTKWSVEVVCVPYDMEVTIEKLNERGFPRVYGSRLR